MGISDGMQGSGGVECLVGSIVWVRRRNGSWWPGKILGPNELSASHLMSPRSGTPVKLLGREDASVDWYNLEKSKRVKAFRCGEFNDCIERAESSQGTSIKKREKYARREDAILHALELEKQQLEKKQLKSAVTSNCTSSKKPGALKQELSTHSENLGSDHGKFGNRKPPLSKRLEPSVEEESMGNPLYANKAKYGKQLNREDDNSKVTPRMRGLQDFGLRIAPSKRKLSVSVASEGSRRLSSVDNHLLTLPSADPNIGGANHVSNSSSLAVKRKRSQGGIGEESLVRRRDRRRPLVQVLQSSVKLPSSRPDSDAVSISVKGEKEQTEVIFRAKRSRCVYLPVESNVCIDHTEFPLDQSQISPSKFGIDNDHPHTGSLTEENTSSGLLEDAESDSSEGGYLDPDTMDEEITLLSGATEMQAAVEPRIPDVCQVQGQIGIVNSEEVDESALTGHISNLHPRDQAAAVSAVVGVSKWQLKGKRNIRNLTKRPVEVMDGKVSNGSIHGLYHEGKGNNLNQRPSEQGFYHRSAELRHAYDEGDLINKDVIQTQMVGFGSRRYLLPSQSRYKDRSRISPDITDSDEDSVWEADGLSHSALGGYREDLECFDSVYVGHYHGNVMESMLVDVDLKVQASYQGEHVPLVSLMSRLNGKAIIGHPIQIEALEHGSSDILLSTNGDFGNDPINNDGSTQLPPVWRTGRRTAMHRVPRPQPSSALEGDETAEPPQYSDPENRSSNKQLYEAGHLDRKAALMRNNFSHARRPPKGKKFQRKLLKKVILSSQKTRTLSSIAIEQELGGKSGDPKLASKSSMDGLIKPEDSRPTTVSCIPVKLVFSRLLEAVGRLPSKAANHGVLMNGDIEKQLS